MSVSPETISNNQPIIYLPHHGVLKQNSLTTKLRVVFDGSAKSSSGLSLNNALMVGPTLQEDLVSILLRFRTHRYAITADITKMYRQILIDKSQTSLQRILWRNDEHEKLKSYDLLTVTYGTSSASYLAIRSLRPLAKLEKNNFSVGSLIALRDFYVDDLITGANTYEEAFSIINEVDALLKTGRFVLQKWVSNYPRLVQHLQSSLREHVVINLDKNNSVYTLGMQWNIIHDCFQFTVPEFPKLLKVTKRIILSNISQLFDPLGLLAPIIIVGKIMIQQIWQSKLYWDETVPLNIYTKWINFQQQLCNLKSINVLRWLINRDSYEFLELHGFCDSSESAYGACIYIRVGNHDNASCTLVTAKSRVAPIKAVSLPRLELNGALLLTRLMKKIQQFLAWITSPARDWKTHVANRVSEIQDLTNYANWHHVRSQDNPADLISRGTTPIELIKCDIWWHAPSWLSAASCMWLVNQESILPFKSDCERRVVSARAVISNTFDNIFYKFSSFNKLIRIVGYCLRFYTNLKNKIKTLHLTTGPLSTQELNLTTVTLLRIAQRECFGAELNALSSQKSIASNSKIFSLNPFLDANGNIRVGGRLHNAKLSYNHKHPILLPKGHPLTKLIIKHFHLIQLHAGVENTLAAVRHFYWPISGKNLVKEVITKCIVCFKVKPISAEYIMGNLPTNRVTISRAFANCGIDYFGPLYLKESKRRNSKRLKAYGAVFICMAIKAVHIELVSELTTEGFITALKRFISRRGKPNNIYSDNATNFVGAKNELAQLQEIFNSEHSKSKITTNVHSDGIAWHFITPRSPHFGGLSESLIKSVKYHLIRKIGHALLTYEEISAVLIQIEAILNSRPLTPLSNDPNDFTVLTPAHFLIGDSPINLCEPEVLTLPINRLLRWQYIERLKQQFWKQWTNQYLSTLQQRKKWKSTSKNLEPGQVIIIRKDNTPPLQWSIGRIEEVHPGSDGVVRAATVRTCKGNYKRTIMKLCPLPIDY